jgi:Domain of unknown function (DUF4160)
VPVIDGEVEIADPSDNENSLIGASGIDALAYYAPFHFYRRNHWGIYVRDFGVTYLASRFLGRSTLERSDNWALRCAYWLLFEHEYFHFQTEVAAAQYEMLTGDLSAYEHMFHDGRASWLEESMANARAHRHMHDHEDALLTFSRLEFFKGFASSWMKTQPPGYRDFDRWCRTNPAMQKGLAAITSRLHEISCYLRHQRRDVTSEVLRPYENADYSRVPVVRVHDSRIPWLKSAKLFPKESGIQVMVHTREHPPVHIHVEFSDGSKSVRLEWPSLNPLRGELGLSAREKKILQNYLGKYQPDILEKLRRVYGQSNLPCAL